MGEREKAFSSFRIYWAEREKREEREREESMAGGKDEIEEEGVIDERHGMGNVREQDRYLPIANISRIMKKSLPTNAKIAKDAKETVQECVSEFISFITSE